MSEMDMPEWVKTRLDLRSKQISSRGKQIPGKERFELTAEQQKMLKAYQESSKFSPEDVEAFAREVMRGRNGKTRPR